MTRASGWSRFIRIPPGRTLVKVRGFDREEKVESRTFCPCELCRLRFNRMLHNRFRSSDAIRTYERHPRRNQPFFPAIRPYEWEGT